MCCRRGQSTYAAPATLIQIKGLSGSTTHTHGPTAAELHLPRMALVFAYRAFPCAVFPPTAQKPLMPNALRACLQASHHFFNALPAQFFFARADAALLTIFPDLLLTRVALVRPPTVFTFLPLKTAALAALPRAMTLTFFTFFMAFFIAAAFIAFM